MAKSKTLEAALPQIIFKSSMQRSGNTVERYRSPTNPRTANAMTQYIFDYKEQARVFPDRDPGTIVEATQNRHDDSYRTVNKGGRSASLGALSQAEIGGSPDERGFQAKYFRSR